MCLHTIWSKQHKESWLNKQPQTITAYKVVAKRSESAQVYTPLYSHTTARTPTFRQHNKHLPYKVKDLPPQVHVPVQDVCYTPYFHLFTALSAAVALRNYVIGLRQYYKMNPWKFVIVKCTIPKDQITDIGFEYIRVAVNSTNSTCKPITLVTKEFSIKGEVDVASD